MFKSLVRLNPEKLCRQRGLNPGSSALEADALTTRPTRRSNVRESRKKSANILPTQVETISVPADQYWHSFEGNLGETPESWGGVHEGFPKHYNAIVEIKRIREWDLH